MPRVGIVAYSNNSGLGSIAANFRKFLNLDSQLVIRHPIKGTFDIDIPHTFGDNALTIDQINEYLDTCQPEVIIFLETPFNFEFFKIAHVRGIKTVLIPMIDSIGVDRFKPYEEYIDLVINVTSIGHQIYADKWPGSGINGVHIPYPIDTDYFCPSDTPAEYTFAHSEGWGGAGFRKSTDLVLSAFAQLCHIRKDKPTLWVHGQPGERQHSQLARESTTIIVQQEDLAEAVDIYRKGRIYVAPSRREGLGLPILEAMSCGLPVIATDAPPMNSWFPEPPRSYSLLVPVQSQIELPYGDIPMFTPNVFELMNTMFFACDDLQQKTMERIGKQNRIIIQEKFSWDVLKSRYLEVLHT
ncbi:MAG: glycosyltransferase family 4 protein [Candidatus Baldrarchaeia archaeon]